MVLAIFRRFFVWMIPVHCLKSLEFQRFCGFDYFCVDNPSMCYTNKREFYNYLRVSYAISVPDGTVTPAPRR